MKYSIRSLFVLIAVVVSFGCTEDISNVPAKSGPDHERSADLAPDPAIEFLLEQQLEHEKRMLLRGMRKCEDYLNNNMLEDFCASEVPENWTPFEFNNETYYIQPLAVSSD